MDEDDIPASRGQYQVIGGGMAPKTCRSKAHALLTARERTRKSLHGPAVVLDTINHEVLTP